MDMTRTLSTIGLRWNFCAAVILALMVECLSLDVSTKVDIMSSKYLGDNVIITCSVSSLSSEDIRKHNVYLYCPLLGDDNICYINCDSLLLTDKGQPIFTNVFFSCENTWNNKNRIEFQYILSSRHIDVMGQWHCEYKTQKSSNITIRKYQLKSTVPPEITSMASSTGSSLGPPIQSQTTIVTTCQIPNNNSLLMAGIICAFSISAVINALMIILFCVSRCDTLKLRQQMKSVSSDKYPPEALSILSRNSNGQMALSHSMCSRTPSLDSPSNKESFSTYIQDTIHSNSCQSPTFYIQPDGRIISMTSPTNSQMFNLERQMNERKELSPTNQTFVPIVQMRKYKPQRKSAQLTYTGNLLQNQPQQNASYLAGRTCNSHQQLHSDSNDESGIGSESLCNYYIQKPLPYLVGDDQVDLIHGCDPVIMLKRSSAES